MAIQNFVWALFPDWAPIKMEKKICVIGQSDLSDWGPDQPHINYVIHEIYTFCSRVKYGYKN